MSAPADTPIAVGRPHRTWRGLTAFEHDYDDPGVMTRFLPEGTVFQPWEPLPHWRGEHVPITLGDQATQFDWGVASRKGLFLAWDDYFAFCGTGEAPRTGRNATLPGGQPMPMPGEKWPAPFRELPAIMARLRAQAGPDLRPHVETVLKIVEALAKAHAAAAHSQRAAEGFDNSDEARAYQAEQEGLLAFARTLLDACRAASLPPPPLG